MEATLSSQLTEYEFWHTLNEPEPVIKSISDGSKLYMWHNDQGQIHRENDLPAVIWYYNNGNIEEECWHQNGEIHRIGGSAVICYHEDGSINLEEWYLNGEPFYEEEYWNKLKELGYAY